MWRRLKEKENLLSSSFLTTLFGRCVNGGHSATPFHARNCWMTIPFLSFFHSLARKQGSWRHDWSVILIIFLFFKKVKNDLCLDDVVGKSAATVGRFNHAARHTHTHRCIARVGWTRRVSVHLGKPGEKDDYFVTLQVWCGVYSTLSSLYCCCLLWIDVITSSCSSHRVSVHTRASCQVSFTFLLIIFCFASKTG